MFCTAAMADTVMGKTLARKMRKIGALSVTLNQRMATGIQAMGEMGRSIWIIGLNAWKAQPYQPSNRPNGTPINTARAKPHVTRNSEATMYFSSNPFWISSTMPRKTSSGLGKISLPDSAHAEVPRQEEKRRDAQRQENLAHPMAVPRARHRSFPAHSVAGVPVLHGCRPVVGGGAAALAARFVPMSHA